MPRQPPRRWDPWDARGPFPSFPAAKPRPVEGGLAARSRRGAIGATWWSQRFVAVLESFDLGARLQRGKRYARMGQVVDLAVTAGRVTATVQGSRARPYRVEITAGVLSGAEWDQVEGALAGRAAYAARLLAGDMPTDIEDAFAACSLSLFPARAQDLRTSCSCPDWANPCKHVAAACFLLAEAFDDDPFLIFAWRGRGRAELLRGLKARRGAFPAPTAPPGAAGPPDTRDTPELPLAGFWSAGPGLATVEAHPRSSPVPDALVRQLPPLPLDVRGEPVARLLAPALVAASAHAATRALAAGSPPGDDAGGQDPPLPRPRRSARRSTA